MLWNAESSTNVLIAHVQLTLYDKMTLLSIPALTLSYHYPKFTVNDKTPLAVIPLLKIPLETERESERNSHAEASGRLISKPVSPLLAQRTDSSTSTELSECGMGWDGGDSSWNANCGADSLYRAPRLQ